MMAIVTTQMMNNWRKGLPRNWDKRTWMEMKPGRV
ncbi:hypothetical protein SETIT_6G037900v2 [Setaria italica]|uniref:Uncharacterized protein n=1 Tax=Setaria italica TaxID=4555 RepID=A0A368RHZ3_SETIT|nr:hypothetical protein SETIT_6G037900v2 [Setaria italica]